MAAYGRKACEGRLQFVDISLPEFDPSCYCIPQTEFMFELHVIDREGRVYKGVEAFWAIWQALPPAMLYRALGWLVTWHGFNVLAKIAYFCFARLRRYLPKVRNTSCRGGSCRRGH